MKTKAKFKSFTDGLAVFLAVLIAIYFLIGFMKTDSKDGQKLSFTEKIEKMMDNAVYKGYFHILLLLILSAAVGIILRRMPWLSVMTASFALFYELNMLTCKLLSRYPTGVILFTAAHLAGAVAYAAYCDHGKLTRLACPFGGFAVGLVGAGFSAYIASLCERAAACAETVALLRSESVIINNAVIPIPGAVNRIYSVFVSEGREAARTLCNEYFGSLGKNGVRSNFLSSVDGSQAGFYLGMWLVFLGAATLAFVLSGKVFYRLSAIASCLPLAVCTLRLINEQLSAGGVVLLAAAVISAVCMTAELAFSGKTDDTESAEALPDGEDAPHADPPESCTEPES